MVSIAWGCASEKGKKKANINVAGLGWVVEEEPCSNCVTISPCFAEVKTLRVGQGGSGIKKHTDVMKALSNHHQKKTEVDISRKEHAENNRIIVLVDKYNGNPGRCINFVF